MVERWITAALICQRVALINMLNKLLLVLRCEVPRNHFIRLLNFGLGTPRFGLGDKAAFIALNTLFLDVIWLDRVRLLEGLVCLRWPGSVEVFLLVDLLLDVCLGSFKRVCFGALFASCGICGVFEVYLFGLLLVVDLEGVMDGRWFLAPFFNNGAS